MSYNLVKYGCLEFDNMCKLNFLIYNDHDKNILFLYNCGVDVSLRLNKKNITFLRQFFK